MPDTYRSGWEEEEQLVRQAVAWAAGLGHECPAEVWEPAGLAAICDRKRPAVLRWSCKWLRLGQVYPPFPEFRPHPHSRPLRALSLGLRESWIGVPALHSEAVWPWPAKLSFLSLKGLLRKRTMLCELPRRWARFLGSALLDARH